MAIYCSNCGASLPDGVAFCDACGTPVRGQPKGTGAPPQPFTAGPGASQGAAGSVACSVCGATALPGEAFCDNCGAALLPSSFYPQGTVEGPSLSQPLPPSYSQAPLGSYPSVAQRTATFVLTSPPPPATIAIPDRPELIVGRSDPQSNSYPEVDLGPYGGLDLGISRRHFRLSHNGDQFYVEDLNSVNGTVVNGQRIPPHTLHPLRSGDHLSLGKMEMNFELT